AVARAGRGRSVGARGRLRGRDGADPAVREPRVPGAAALRGDHPSAWCLIVFPSATNTTSSAMLVARSATRSRLRLTRNRSIAAPMMCGSSIMWVSRIRNTDRFRASTESSRRQVSGHGLLRGEQVDHRFLDLELEGVDGAIARDHAARVLGVALEQRVEGVTQSFLGLARHGEQLGLEPGELVVKVAVCRARRGG